MEARWQVRLPVRPRGNRLRVRKVMPGLANGGAQGHAAKGEFAPPFGDSALNREFLLGEQRRRDLRQGQHRAAVAGWQQAPRKIAQRLSV